MLNGGWGGTRFVIRPGNHGTDYLASNDTGNRELWERARDNFAVQLTDGMIAVYMADSDGVKGDMIVKLNDKRIIKSKLNTLTATGGWGGSGVARFRGIYVGMT